MKKTLVLTKKNSNSAKTGKTLILTKKKSNPDPVKHYRKAYV